MTSEKETARSYENILDIMKALKRRGPFYHIAVNPTDEREFDEIRARVMEDELWPKELGEAPRIIPIPSQRKGYWQPVDIRDLAPKRMAEVVNSTSGFGRFSQLYVPSKARKEMDR